MTTRTQSRLLFASTLAVALASSFAFAAPAFAQDKTREQVVAEFQKARADGTLRKNDYDYDAGDGRAASTRTRADTVGEMAKARSDNKLVGPWRSGSYNPYGASALQATKADRAEVKAGVVAAQKKGQLRRTDYDDVKG